MKSIKSRTIDSRLNRVVFTRFFEKNFESGIDELNEIMDTLIPYDIYNWQVQIFSVIITLRKIMLIKSNYIIND